MTLHDNLASLGLSKSSIVREIQRDLIEESLSTSAILRKARLTAKKLDLRDFLQWIINESDGYKNIRAVDLPSYRRIAVIPKFFNPYNGWCPIFIEDKQIYELCRTGYAHQSIEEIEALGQSDHLLYSYPNEICSYLRSRMEFDFEIRGVVSSTQLKGIPNAVRNVLLDWAVDLEHAGVMGEGLGFSNVDKSEAAAVTQNIYAQNIGNVGSVSDQSTVHNSISGNKFSLNLLGDYMNHIQSALPGVPDDSRGRIEREIKKLNDAQKSRDETTARRCLKAIQTICEGAASSLAAQGIAAYIATLFT